MMNEDCKKILQQYQDRKAVVIYGVETHVCVHQTTLALLSNGTISCTLADKDTPCT